MKDLKDKFKRAGGTQILRQYMRSHVLGFALVQAALQGTSQKSLEIVRLGVYNKVLARLRRKYRPYIEEYLRREKDSPARERRQADHIWILWLDGSRHRTGLLQVCSEMLSGQADPHSHRGQLQGLCEISRLYPG